MVNAYLQAKPGTNVVLLDWSNMGHGFYLLNAAKNTKKVGTAAAEQINRLMEAGLLLENIHIIGFSLGSHVAGYIARDLKNKFNKKLKDLCSHMRSWRLYAESVLNPEAFPASPAGSYIMFSQNPAPETGMVYMGINCDNRAQGSYYLTTNSQTPFGKGMAGLYP